MAKSTFKLHSSFLPALRTRAAAIERAAYEAMAKAMNQAEADAKTMYEWRKPGTYRAVDSSGAEWEWEVTGVAADSIQAYVVGRGPKTAGVGRETTYITRRSEYGGGSFLTTYRHEHYADPGLLPTHSPAPGRVTGIVTMNPVYVQYLQSKEVTGGTWGVPDTGPNRPVTVEVLEVFWENQYVPHIIAPHIARVMSRFS